MDGKLEKWTVNNYVAYVISVLLRLFITSEYCKLVKEVTTDALFIILRQVTTVTNPNKKIIAKLLCMELVHILDHLLAS